MDISKYKDIFSERLIEKHATKETIDNHFRHAKRFFENSKESCPEHISEFELNSFLENVDNIHTRRNYLVSVKKFYNICLIKNNNLSLIVEKYKNNKQSILSTKNSEIAKQIIFGKSFFGKLNTKRIKRQKLKEKLCGT